MENLYEFYTWAIDEKNQLMRGGKKEQAACLSVLNSLKARNPALWDKVNELSEETRFVTRAYSGRRLYTWAEHDNLGSIDPWPSSRFPKAVVAYEHLLALTR